MQTASPSNRAADAMRPYLLLSVAVLSWAANFVLGRHLHDQVPAATLNFGRWLVAFAVLLPFALPEMIRQRTLLRRHWRYLTLLGVTGVSVFHTLVYAALHHTSALNAALIMAATPVVIVLLSWYRHRDRITTPQAAGIAVSLIGAAIIITRGDLLALGALHAYPGDLLMLLAMPCWALYSVLLKERPTEASDITLLGAVVVTGLALQTAGLAWDRWSEQGIEWGTPVVLGFLFLGVFPSVVAYTFWNRGVAVIGAGRAGQFMYLMPVFSALLAIGLLGEHLRGFHLGGIALVFTGIVIVNRTRPRQSAGAPAAPPQS